LLLHSPTQRKDQHPAGRRSRPGRSEAASPAGSPAAPFAAGKLVLRAADVPVSAGHGPILPAEGCPDTNRCSPSLGRSRFPSHCGTGELCPGRAGLGAAGPARARRRPEALPGAPQLSPGSGGGRGEAGRGHSSGPSARVQGSLAPFAPRPAVRAAGAMAPVPRGHGEGLVSFSRCPGEPGGLLHGTLPQRPAAAMAEGPAPSSGLRRTAAAARAGGRRGEAAEGAAELGSKGELGGAGRETGPGGWGPSERR